jgi:signal transduction histidine kinase
MPDEVKEKIFDPFFTTKPIGEAQVLGYLLFMDCASHQAEINVESEVGRGTTFTIRFPEKPDISTMIPEPKGEEDSESTIHGRFDD